MGRGFKYEPKHIAFLRERVPLFPWKRVTEMFNQEFNTTLTLSALRQYCNNRKINRPLEAQHFQKGLIPWNKGVKGYMGANATSFKKGDLPYSTQLVGTERICPKDNLVYVKIAMPNVWKQRSHLVLEKAGIPIPEGCAVFHINGESTDDSLENLLVISRSEILTINSYIRLHGIAYKDMPPELKELVLIQTKLNQRIKERKRELLQSKHSN